MNKIKLYCVPHSGGSSIVYMKWKKFLHQSIELVPMELAGRGMRFNEPPYESFREAVEDIYNSIKGNSEDTPYAFFGHSLGSWLVYEVYYKLMESKERLPVHLFFSGRRAPDINGDGILYHSLSDEELKQELIKLGGTPQEILNHHDAMEHFLKIIKADLRMLDLYEWVERSSKIKCGITILNGKQDKIKMRELLAWKKHTQATCSMFNLNGGHFFISENTQEVVKIVNDALVDSILLEVVSGG